MNPLHTKACISLVCSLLPAAALAQTGAALKAGELVYQETCMACHGNGVANAPRFGDKKAWAKLIKEGQVPLTVDGWIGVRGMPAKGGRAELQLEEFARATAWMANAAGANWKDPDVKLMDQIRKLEGRRQAAAKKRGN